jgi:hypothetical protein
MLLTIIALSCFAVLFTTASGIVQSIKFKLKIKRWKPFDCPMCFGFWIGLAYFLFQQQYLMALPLAATVSILSIYIEKIIRP